MDPQILLVGGAVRDKFLGQIPSDKDYVAVGYSPEHFDNLGYKCVGQSFPVYIDNEGNEIALARTERKLSRGTQGFSTEVANVSLEEDLYRRDLTISSMAYDEANDIIYDPYNGRKDIKNKVLRHTSDAFKEDPVRVLRLARINTMLPDFRIHKSTKLLVGSMKDELGYLQPDRVWKEIVKVFALPNSYIFFEKLLELNVLDIIFPHIFDMVTCKEGSKHHLEGSVFIHTMMVLKELSNEPIEVQLAGLFHDIAKPYMHINYGSGHGHENCPQVEQFIDETLPSLPRQVRKKVLMLCHNHTTIYKLHQMKPSKVGRYLYQYRKDLDTLTWQLILARADDLGRITNESKSIDNIPTYTIAKAISEYSPAKWITITGNKNSLAISNHIIETNASIVRQYT